MSSLRDRLKQLFLTKVVIVNTGKGLKIADPEQVQSSIRQGFVDRYTKLYSSMAGGTGKAQQLFMAAQRLSLFKDYECISGDTIIPTPDGKQLTIKELANKYPTKNDRFYVYSYDHELDSVELGMAHSVRKTKTEITYKITFDDGKYILATANHPFLMKNGEYKTVDTLNCGDLVMPFYQIRFYEHASYSQEILDYKIISIEKYKILDVYDMTVEKYHNFATDSCFVHNSMESDSIIASALDIYADECLGAETVIPLLDGRKLTIKELFDTQEQNFWLHGLNAEGIFIPAKAKKVVYKGKAEVYKITLEDGTILKSTGNHRWVNNMQKLVYTENLNVGDGIYALNTTFGVKWVSCNYKITSIEKLPDMEDVYDIVDVGTNHIYALEANDGSKIYTHNSTMKSDYGEVLTIYSENDKIRDVLYNLFYDVLNIEFNLWPWTRNMCKYGDFYLYLNIMKKYGIVNVTPISPYDIVRVEGENPENPGEVKFEIAGGDNRHSQRSYNRQTFEEFEIGHFRLIGDSNMLPYGKSMVEGGRKTWKQLQLMEDAMLIHRIMRAPERRVFKIDIGNIPPAEVEPYMKRIIDKMKKAPVMNDRGEYNLKFNMQNLTEDIFVPVRGGDGGTDISTLDGLEYDATDDIEYMQNKLMAALKIPKAFLGYEEGLGCVVPETKIPLLNGEIKTVQEIINDYESGIKHYVYSFDTNINKMVPGEVEWAGFTNRNAKLVRVNLDNNKFIDCTPDHKFLTRTGEWVEAQDLQENQSLMPLYLNKSEAENITIYQPANEKYQSVRKMIEEYYNSIEQDNDNIILKYCNLTKNNNYIEDSNNYYMHYLNHRVISVEFLPETKDTCDLTIKNYHNFATDSGVIIHNSKATLAAEDVRFGRTIERIQRTLVSELTKIAIVHLMAQGFKEKDLLNFELKLTNPSSIYEQEQLEKWDARVNLASSILEDGLMSSEWIYDNIFKFTSRDKEKIRLGILSDKKRKFRWQQLEDEGNDPLKSHEAVGTQGSLAQKYGDKGGSPPGGQEGAGRPSEIKHFAKDGSARGRDPLGKHDLKKAGSSSSKYGKSLALAHYKSLKNADLSTFSNKDKKLLSETTEVVKDYLDEVSVNDE